MYHMGYVTIHLRPKKNTVGVEVINALSRKDVKINITSQLFDELFEFVL